VDGWMDGWMGGCKSRFKDCLQQSTRLIKTWVLLLSGLNNKNYNISYV
jgi:hypothetical protein